MSQDTTLGIFILNTFCRWLSQGKTRCRGHSKYIRSEYEAVRMKYRRPITTVRLGLCPRPRISVVASSAYWLPNQHKKLKTNQAITLVNFTTSMWIDRLCYFLSLKTGLKSKFSKSFTISNTNKLHQLT